MTAMQPQRKASSLSTPKHQGETALYIARLSGELSALAKASQLDMTAYFLDMAQMEANCVAFDTHLR